MMFYPGSGPLDGGKTLRHALVYIDIDVLIEYRVDLPRDLKMWSNSRARQMRLR